MWPAWTRRLWLALLLLSWALAAGLHDFVLADDHHHDCASPEHVITQVWHSDVVPSVAIPAPLIGPAILILILLWVPLALEQPGVPPRPESRHSPPRPPNLKNLLFRGPPALALPFAKSWKLEISRAQKNHRAALAGRQPAAACPTA